MKKNILIFITFIIYCSNCYSQTASAVSRPIFVDIMKINPNDLPSGVVWINPEIDAKVSEENNFIVKAGILSTEKIKSVKLFINGLEEKDFRLNIPTSGPQSFKENIDKAVGLQKQNNEIKIVVETESGKVITDKRSVLVKGIGDEASEVNSSSPAETSISASQLTEELGIKKNYALLIGVQNYSDISLNTLTTPISEVQAVKEVLENNYTFNPEDIIVLGNPDWAGIVKAFEKLNTIVTPADNLLIFYSGHGMWDKEIKKGYWLPSNAKKSDKFDWFSNADLKDYIAGINAKHTLLVSDACFNGNVMKKKDSFTQKITNESLMERFKKPSRQVMTSGAMVTVPDKSIFLKYFLMGLKENKAPFISAEQLFIGFKSPVSNNSPNKQVPRFGEIIGTGDKGGDFVFIRR